ncbi:DUF3037 domain-containing protein [Ferruginibacter paludis]|uniref:DUF3037 domain-containing protein n=1 Tax=Ferruginibacter paludis TaxID=1310417 RepID=UPI0025B62853|nr:DUF3037 domain-containing protein [Ferruginibacter paludis]MDN3655201.1 DUF3037 domain-containing protein [Ferruginibacter paludis]
MPDHLFEYAVIRIVPRVEREEFLNVGVILYCAKEHFLQAKVCLNEDRLAAFCMETDKAELKQHLDAIQRICVGDSSAGPIAKLDIAARFRWLTATRSTVVQTSKVHPGFCKNPGQTLAKLYTRLVL